MEDIHIRYMVTIFTLSMKVTTHSPKFQVEITQWGKNKTNNESIRHF